MHEKNRKKWSKPGKSPKNAFESFVIRIQNSHHQKENDLPKFHAFARISRQIQEFCTIYVSMFCLNLQ